MSGTCYYPDGSVSQGGFPCSNSATTRDGPCCGLGHLCASNGLCIANDMTIYRGSCTDRNWQSSDCPKICVEQNRSALVGIQPCGRGTFSCTNGCANNKDVFALPTEELTVIRATATATSTPTSSASGSVIPTQCSGFSNTTTAAAAAPSCAVTVGEVVGVGAGIGIPLLLALLGALFLYNRERKRNHYKDVHSSVQEIANNERKFKAPQAIPGSDTSSSGKTLHANELSSSNQFNELEGNTPPVVAPARQQGVFKYK